MSYLGLLFVSCLSVVFWVCCDFSYRHSWTTRLPRRSRVSWTERLETFNKCSILVGQIRVVFVKLKLSPKLSPIYLSWIAARHAHPSWCVTLWDCRSIWAISENKEGTFWKIEHLPKISTSGLGYKKQKDDFHSNSSLQMVANDSILSDLFCHSNNNNNLITCFTRMLFWPHCQSTNT